MSNPLSHGTFRFASTAAVSLIGAALLPGSATAAVHHGSATSCAHAKHRYIEATAAKVKATVITVHAHSATFHCGGPDDGSYTVSHKSETLTVSTHAVVKVFPSPEDPSSRKTVKASKLPHWLKHNKSEPIYRIVGPATGVTKLTEQFHP